MNHLSCTEINTNSGGKRGIPYIFFFLLLVIFPSAEFFYQYYISSVNAPANAKIFLKIMIKIMD